MLEQVDSEEGAVVVQPAKNAIKDGCRKNVEQKLLCNTFSDIVLDVPICCEIVYPGKVAPVREFLRFLVVQSCICRLRKCAFYS